MKRLALVLCTVLFLGACVSEGLMRLVATQDQLDYRVNHMRDRASQVKSPVVPLVRVGVPFDGVDEIRSLPGGRVLASLILTSGMNDAVLFGEYGPYAVYDMTDGKEIWRYERPRAYDQHDWGILAVEPVVLLQHSTPDSLTVIALQADTGDRLWERALPVGAQVIPAAESGLVVLLLRDGASFRLAAHDVKTGIERWHAAAQAGPQAQPPVTALTESSLLVVTASAECRSLKDGGILWTASQVGPASAQVPPLRLADGWLIAAREPLLSRIRTDGSVAWQKRLGSPARLLSSNDTTCIAVLETDPAISRLVAMRLADGQTRWERTPGGQVHSAVVWSGKRLLFTTTAQDAQNSLDLLDGETGGTLRTAALWSGDPDRLVDQLLVGQDQVLVSAEKWAGAFGLPDLGARWAYGLVPAFSFQGSLLFAASAFQAATSSGGSGSMMPTQLIADTTHNNVRWAEQNRASVFSLTAAHMTSSATSGERLDASTERAMANQSVGIAREMDASWDRSMAAVSLMSAGVSGMMWAQEAGKAYVYAERDKADRMMRPRAIPQSVRDHLGALHGSYLVRPIFNRYYAPDLVGVLVVETATGRWCEVVTAPRHMSIYRLLTQVAVSRDGRKLVTNGIGLDPARWEINSRLSVEKEINTALQVFDLSALPFRPPAEFAGSSVQREPEPAK